MIHDEYEPYQPKIEWAENTKGYILVGEMPIQLKTEGLVKTIEEN